MTYFKRNRELDATLASNTTMNRTAFFKLLALGLFDILLTLPLSIVGLVEDLLQGGPWHHGILARMENCTRILLYHPHSYFGGVEISGVLGGIYYQV